MSEHGHGHEEEHAHGAPDTHAEHGHGDHGGHDDHGHGHDDHGHDGHGDHGDHGGWGDYNAKPPAPSTLPPISAFGLAAMGLVLALLMGTIVYASLSLAAAESSHSEKKAEH